jgi:hypothetical protein
MRKQIKRSIFFFPFLSVTSSISFAFYLSFDEVSQAFATNSFLFTFFQPSSSSLYLAASSLNNIAEDVE